MKCDVTPDVVCHPVGWGGASRVLLVIVVLAVAIKCLTKPYSRVSNSMCFTYTLAHILITFPYFICFTLN